MANADIYQLHDFWDPMLLQDILGLSQDPQTVSSWFNSRPFQFLMNIVASC